VPLDSFDQTTQYLFRRHGRPRNKGSSSEAARATFGSSRQSGPVSCAFRWHLSVDPLLQGRLSSYVDTQLSHLGSPNFHQLPVNAPKCPFANLQRDGIHQLCGPAPKTQWDGRIYFPAVGGLLVFTLGCAAASISPKPRAVSVNFRYCIWKLLLVARMTDSRVIVTSPH
jgi:hypothetical protein